MAENSKIEWTDATWNPITGCSVVSPGCTNCYAMKLAGTRFQHHPSRAGLTKGSKAGPVWTGEVRLNEQWLNQPLRWKRPRRIFVCAHGDLFADGVPDAWIDRVFAVMAQSPQHVFQVLTKRAERMREYVDGDWSMRIIDQLLGAAAGWLSSGRNILPNVWLGVSVEDQTRADERIPHLLATPASVRFVSAEPLLGPLDFTEWLHDVGCPMARGETFCTCYEPREIRLDWIIVGGESGPGARPMHPDWARSIRDQCKAAGVPFFFKQWGEWSPVSLDRDDDDEGGLTPAYPVAGCCADASAHHGGQECLFWQGNRLVHWPHVETFPAIGVRRVGKRAAGSLLDGRQHKEFPK